MGSFFAFILGVLLLLIVVPVMRVILTVWKMKRNLNKQFRRAGEAFGGGDRQPHPEPERNTKVFDKNDGEYVKFEEIEGERPRRNESSRGNEDNRRQEPLITDVEFEEL